VPPRGAQVGTQCLHDLQVLWLLHWLWSRVLQPGSGREEPREVRRGCGYCTGYGAATREGKEGVWLLYWLWSRVVGS
jgi:hypothetical protein